MIEPKNAEKVNVVLYEAEEAFHGFEDIAMKK